MQCSILYGPAGHSAGHKKYICLKSCMGGPRATLIIEKAAICSILTLTTGVQKILLSKKRPHVPCMPPSLKFYHKNAATCSMPAFGRGKGQKCGHMWPRPNFKMQPHINWKATMQATSILASGRFYLKNAATCVTMGRVRGWISKCGHT
jgi:hypothetical protein